jgi:hypothetical protein
MPTDWPTNYTITEKDYGSLINNQWDKYSKLLIKQGYTTKQIYYTELKNQYEIFEGVCSGMSATVLLNRKKKIKVRAHSGVVVENTKGYKLNDIVSPAAIPANGSIMTYYQLAIGEILASGKTFSGSKYLGRKTKAGKKVLGKRSFYMGIKTIYKYAFTKRRAAFLAFRFIDNDGISKKHAVLVLSYKPKTSKDTDYYYFDTYDPSYPGQTTYLRIKRDFSTMDFGYMDGWKRLYEKHENYYYPGTDLIQLIVNLDRFDYLTLNY